MSEELRRLLRQIAFEETTPKEPANFEDSISIILKDDSELPPNCPKCGHGYGVEKVVEIRKKAKINCASCGAYLATKEFGDYGWKVTDKVK